jgi:hypoxanthine phosphoribosyltransferase
VYQLNQDPTDNGYRFNVIVGLSRGGIVVADLLGRLYGGRIPTASLWAEFDPSGEEYSFHPSENWVNEFTMLMLRDERIHNILLVDDVVLRGHTLVRAREAIKQCAPGKNVRTAALLACSSTEKAPDFVARVTPHPIRAPFSMIDLPDNLNGQSGDRFTM